MSDLTALTDDELRDLWAAIEHEFRVRAHLNPHCMHMRNPGPPMYGARCKLPRDHDGMHDFGTETEAYNAFYGSFASLSAKAEAARIEAASRLGGTP